ncbi:peptidyl-prolyl cis-trans isomerase B (cyclophilin B) [Desulfobaculum xiamenense]|uniref:Peptidyl-prolyl cis-trans isomerase n=1 Tax=Desulfobaculum xiamenense TaxID=995050 RepID=A0A846QHN4_9BACT|nr:peptidylprolyl isomerase [Desulfobaculum xiamenense]NJB66537.1 peptidyl-prolyl cis-trans isomerase B (cyclophilin B) [Desulfobaculum xiamenense]
MANPQVWIETTKGDIIIELFEDKAPETVKNFLQYVDDEFYDGTIFHRVIERFMIQGGGMDLMMREKETREPIKNEANNGVANARGTVAMARTMDPHSATAQFFINTVDNGFLNHSSETPDGWGYCVFGQVVDGMKTVDKIAKARTRTQGYHQDVPADAIIINTARRVD